VDSLAETTRFASPAIEKPPLIPILAIFTFMVDGAVGGIVGIHLSVPLVAIPRVVYRQFTSPQSWPHLLARQPKL
jgi:predicted PurR-regulated permease PerM